MNTKTTLDLTASDFSDDENDLYGSFDVKDNIYKDRDSDPFSNLVDSQEKFHGGTYKMGPDSFFNNTSGLKEKNPFEISSVPPEETLQDLINREFSNEDAHLQRRTQGTTNGPFNEDLELLSTSHIVLNPMTSITATNPGVKVSLETVGGKVGSLTNDNSWGGSVDRTPGTLLLYEDLNSTSDRRDHPRDDKGGTRTLIPNYRGYPSMSKEIRESSLPPPVQGFSAGPGGNSHRIIDVSSCYTGREQITG